jgi:uronate dehydrogenase
VNWQNGNYPARSSSFSVCSGEIHPCRKAVFNERWRTVSEEIEASTCFQELGVNVVGDLCDFKGLKATMKGIDVLVHLAATSDEAPFTKELLPNNILGVYNAFQAAYEAGVKRIVFASSCQTVTMYPRDEQVQISQPVRPESVYGATKVFGEVLGRYYHDRFGIEFAGLRLSAFALYGDPDLAHPSWLWRLWLSPRDAVSLFRCAVEKHGIGYTLVFGTSRTKPEFLCLRPARERLGFIPKDDVTKARCRSSGIY